MSLALRPRSSRHLGRTLALCFALFAVALAATDEKVQRPIVPQVLTRYIVAPNIPVTGGTAPAYLDIELNGAAIHVVYPSGESRCAGPGRDATNPLCTASGQKMLACLSSPSFDSPFPCSCSGSSVRPASTQALVACGFYGTDGHTACLSMVLDSTVVAVYQPASAANGICLGTPSPGPAPSPTPAPAPGPTPAPTPKPTPAPSPSCVPLTVAPSLTIADPKFSLLSFKTDISGQKLAIGFRVQVQASTSIAFTADVQCLEGGRCQHHPISVEKPLMFTFSEYIPIATAVAWVDGPLGEAFLWAYDAYTVVKQAIKVAQFGLNLRNCYNDAKVVFSANPCQELASVQQRFGTCELNAKSFSIFDNTAGLTRFQPIATRLSGLPQANIQVVGAYARELAERSRIQASTSGFTFSQASMGAVFEARANGMAFGNMLPLRVTLDPTTSKMHVVALLRNSSVLPVAVDTTTLKSVTVDDAIVTSQKNEGPPETGNDQGVIIGLSVAAAIVAVAALSFGGYHWHKRRRHLQVSSSSHAAALDFPTLC